MARKKQEKCLIVREQLSYVAHLYDVEGTEEEVLSKLKSTFASARLSLLKLGKWTSTSVLKLEINRDVYDYGDSQPRTELEMIHERLENDKEYANRIAKETLYQSTVEAKERADLERLRKKYDKSTSTKR